MKYRLTEKIGSGGMAEVFRAVGEGPESFERPFVIKRIHPRLSEAADFVRMFVDEATISAKLLHPNIVQVFEFAYQDGGYYIVMEPVDGMDMARLLKRLEARGEVPPPAFVAEVGRQACRGLDFAHTLADADGRPLGIVHRDVTPPNIMVAWNGAVKIVDFGIARAAQALRTNMSDKGMVKGKMSYIAPELLTGQPADGRSDVFSLGIVLHELLCGQRLFVGQNDLETLKKVQEQVIEPPSARNPGVKPALDRVVMRALARDPEKRYQSAREMGDELEAIVLREKFSTRLFAKRARELMPVDEESVGEPASGTLGEKNPPIVAPATGAPASAPGRPQPARRAARAQSAGPPRWVAAAIGVPAVAAAFMLGFLMQRQAPAPATPPLAHAETASVTGAAGATTSPAAPSWTVRVALDSVPQGVLVTLAPATPGGEARRIGETPVLFELPRAGKPVELLLTKAGFAPVSFKVIPNQDKDVVAPLERLSGPVVARASSGGGGSMRQASFTSRRTSRSTTTTTTSSSPAPGAAGARPGASAGGGWQPFIATSAAGAKPATVPAAPPKVAPVPAAAPKPAAAPLRAQAPGGPQPARPGLTPASTTAQARR